MDQRIPGVDTPIGTTRASELGNDSNRGTAEQVKQKAREAGSKAADRIEAAVSEQKDRATGELGAIADALRQAGTQLESGNNMSGRFIQAAADRIEDLSSRLDNRDMTQMVGEVRRWARRNPGAFVGAAVAVGFVASRFLKASEDDLDNGFGEYDSFDTMNTGRDYSTGRAYGAGSTGGMDYGTGGAGNLGSGTGSFGGSTGTTGDFGTSGTTGGTTGGLGTTGTAGSGSIGSGTSGTGSTGSTGMGGTDKDGRYGRS